MTAEIIYQELVNLKDNPVKYEYNSEGSLKMSKFKEPWSIKKDEFDYMHDYIVKNNLKRGYEIATAFGISALSLGLAFKKTGGKIVTMDAYIEEHHNSCSAYKNKYNEKYFDSDGYKSVKFLTQKYGLQDTLFAEVGWSPDDTQPNLKKHYNLETEKLDFVFIDGGHWDEAGIRDIKSVLPFIGNKCTFFFHDSNWFGEPVHQLLKDNFGKTFEYVITPPNGWFLSILEVNR